MLASVFYIQGRIDSQGTYAELVEQGIDFGKVVHQEREKPELERQFSNQSATSNELNTVVLLLYLFEMDWYKKCVDLEAKLQNWLDSGILKIKKVHLSTPP